MTQPASILADICTPKMLRRTNVFIRTKGWLQRDMRQPDWLGFRQEDDIVKGLGDGGTDENHDCGYKEGSR